MNEMSGCFSALFATLPSFMLSMAYGEKGMEFRKNCGKSNTLAKFFMNILMFWFFAGLLSLATARKDEKLDVILFTAVPIVIYVVWTVLARMNVKKSLNQIREQAILEKQEEERYRKEGKWKCHNCERINDTTDIICKDCGAYR